jgi:hypothetical protein
LEACARRIGERQERSGVEWSGVEVLKETDARFFPSLILVALPHHFNHFITALFHYHFHGFIKLF